MPKIPTKIGKTPITDATIDQIYDPSSCISLAPKQIKTPQTNANNPDCRHMLEMLPSRLSSSPGGASLNTSGHIPTTNISKPLNPKVPL